VLDVEEGGPDKRSITSLDSATSITITTDMSCFKTSDGKEDCYIDTLAGECDVVNSFASSDGRRHLQEGSPKPNPKPSNTVQPKKPVGRP
jgi:hypothetical protein